MGELWEAYYEHYFYDNPSDIEFKGYEENLSEDGVKYYSFEGDKLLSECESLIGKGLDEEAYQLLNRNIDFSWENTIENDIIKRQKEKAEIPPTSNFLEKMGVGKYE